jgi:hypothetical protein
VVKDGGLIVPALVLGYVGAWSDLSGRLGHDVPIEHENIIPVDGLVISNVKDRGVNTERLYVGTE